MKPKLLSIGNFALSNIYQESNLVKEKRLCGTNFRVLLAAAIYGLPADYITVLGPESDWLYPIERLKQFNIKPKNLERIDESINFCWHYDSKSLVKFESKNIEKMNLIGEHASQNKESLKDYEFINICPLGFETEEKIINFLDVDRQTISYIFHYSNLDSAEAESYLELIKKVDYLFLNFHEAKLLTNQDDIEKAGKFLSKSVKICFITNEDKGLKVFKQEKLILEIPAFCVDVVDSSGAGDILAGGVLVSLAKGETIEVSSRLGTLLAAISLSDYLTDNLIDFLKIKNES